MTSIEIDLESICSLARELGACASVPIAANIIAVDERARLKCIAPLCPNYGRPSCPPHLMPVSEFRTVLERYRYSVLVQWEISLTQAKIQQLFGNVTLADLRQRSDFRELIAGEYREFQRGLDRLEAAAFRLGYRFAAALGCGNCEAFYSSKDFKSEPSPFQPRPSMEGLGIDVFETAHRAGLPLEVPKDDSPVRFNGLLLVD